MLIAWSDGRRVDAIWAQRGADFRCPDCQAPVILRRGRKVVAHFAHRPQATCISHGGETRAHLEAKRLLLDAFLARGLRAEAEFSKDPVPYDRRADLMVWAPDSGTPVAIELQHSRASPADLETRARSYAAAGVAQIWVPFLRRCPGLSAECTDDGAMRIPRYSVQLHDLWMQGMAAEAGLWMYDPADKMFWAARFADQMLMTRETLWYEMGVEKRYSRGGERRSHRFRTLLLRGPWAASQLRLRITTRLAEQTAWFNWPAATLATFVPLCKGSLEQ